MQIGQVPTMFAPTAPVVDVSANTIPDAELQTMFPDQFRPDVPVIAEEPCLLCGATGWLLAGAALVLFWAMRKPRR